MLRPAMPARWGQQLRDSRSTRATTDLLPNERDNSHHNVKNDLRLRRGELILSQVSRWRSLFFCQPSELKARK
jgi:hypothetical protein